MLRDAPHRMQANERTRWWSVLTPHAANRLPQFAEAPPSAEGAFERALSSLSLCQADAHLCATFASTLTTTSPSCIPLYHQEPPVFHRAWLGKSRYLPVTAPRAHLRASDKGETEEQQEAQGARAERKTRRRKTRTRQALGSSSWPRRLTHRLSYCPRQRLLN